MDLTTRITKYVQIVSLLSIILVLAFWSYIEATIPSLTIERLMAIVLAVMGAIFLYLDAKLTTAIRGPTNVLSHKPLTECFHSISEKMNYVKHLRIYALSTGRIHPLFSSTNMHVEKCTILLRGFNDQELSHSDLSRYNSHINDIIKEWEKDAKHRRIDKLIIHRFFFLPTEYYVIFDERAMIVGWFSPTKDGWGDVEEPIVILDNSQEGATLIHKYIDRFDRFATMITKRA